MMISSHATIVKRAADNDATNVSIVSRGGTVSETEKTLVSGTPLAIPTETTKADTSNVGNAVSTVAVDMPAKAAPLMLCARRVLSFAIDLARGGWPKGDLVIFMEAGSLAVRLPDAEDPQPAAFMTVLAGVGLDAPAQAARVLSAWSEFGELSSSDFEEYGAPYSLAYDLSVAVVRVPHGVLTYGGKLVGFGPSESLRATFLGAMRWAPSEGVQSCACGALVPQAASVHIHPSGIWWCAACAAQEMPISQHRSRSDAIANPGVAWGGEQEKETDCVRSALAPETRSSPHYLGVPISQMTDKDDADRLVNAIGDRTRFIRRSREWTFYDGGCWDRVDDLKLKGAALDVFTKARADAERMVQESGGKTPRDGWQAFANHVRKRLDRSRFDAAITMLTNLERISACEADFDGPDTSMLLNVLNGTIDLEKGVLREHRQEDMITRKLDIAFDPDAECPRFDAFMEQAFDDPDTREFVDRLAGYCLTASTKEEKLFLFGKTAGSGKSVLVATAACVLGSYACNVESSSLTEERDLKSIPSDIMRTKGARLLIVNELERSARLAQSLVKKLTSGDATTARSLYKNDEEFHPTGKIVMSTNHWPQVDGKDTAILDRILVVPFRKRFRGTSQQDQDLISKLKAERVGILARWVRGCREWQQRGLDPPPDVLNATKEYHAAQNNLPAWATKYLSLDPSAWTATSVLYDSYMAWCGRGDNHPVAYSEFGRRIARLPGVSAERSRVEGGRQARGWRGLRLEVEGRGAGPLPTPVPTERDGSSNDVGS